MPLQATSGAASYDAFGGGVAAVPNYIEDVFSTYLYTGNGSTQTITNGIDLAGKGGMVWTAARNVADNKRIWDSERGVNKDISTNSTAAQSTRTGALTAFNADGFSLGTDLAGVVNANSGEIYASWTFRKAPKFFDVVTGTANSSGNVSFNHSLGSAPGFVIIKSTTNASTWTCYHQSLGPDKLIQLNTTNAAQDVSGFFTSTATTFSANTGFGAGAVGFVAYLFAHNAGGFGLSGTDNVISCGSMTVNGSGEATVDLGYEPQFIIAKPSSTTGNWQMFDNMRGLTVTTSRILYPNLSNAEGSTTGIKLTSTGFTVDGNFGVGEGGATYIYIAIRRGPMKTPTTGTSVFAPLALNNTAGTKNTTNFPVDFQFSVERNGVHNTFVMDRLRGVITTAADAASPNLKTNSTAAEASDVTGLTRYWDNTGFQTGSYQDSAPTAYWNFRRAPGFFDEVCYTGDGAASRNITHNLTVTPELILAKSRSNAANWVAYNAFGNGLILNSAAAANSGFNFITSATASTFTPADPASFGGSPNQSGQTYVAYLFASCPGVSKVTNFTGTGTLQTINCGFTGGARFVLIKRTDSTGNWFVWDSSRGLSSSNDPYLMLNSTAAEVTSTNWVDTTATGFQVTAASGNDVNINGASYIALAIA